MARILILKEKHADLYYDITSNEQRAKVFLDILRSRQKTSYYYYEPKEPNLTLSVENQEIFDLTDEKLALLPTALRESMITKRNRLIRNRKTAEHAYRVEKEFWDSVVATLALPEEEAMIKGKTGRYGFISEAESLLASRSDYQYESYDIEDTLN
jgi:hypothetical protein